MPPASAAAEPIKPVCLADYERLAQAQLPGPAWAYLAGGAADELTLAANLQAWRGLALWPRVGRDMGTVSSAVPLLGRTWPTPILAAPMAQQRLFHPDGEAAMALAAAAQGAGFVLSTLASAGLEDVAALVRHEPDRGPLWFQLYLQHDAGFNAALVQRVEDAGFEAIVLTLDAAYSGVRDRERRAGSSAALAPVPTPNLRGLAAAPAGMPPHRAVRWAEVEALQASTRLPLLLKGVLHPADVQQAAALGVAGVVVSNHGGRTLDTVPASAHALPLCAQALHARPGASRPALLVDGGIRRGTDVLKALALGADAVLVGRPLLAALAVGGAPAVAQALRWLRDELHVAQVLSGFATLDRVGTDLLGIGC